MTPPIRTGVTYVQPNGQGPISKQTTVYGRYGTKTTTEPNACGQAAYPDMAEAEVGGTYIICEVPDPKKAVARTTISPEQALNYAADQAANAVAVLKGPSGSSPISVVVGDAADEAAATTLPEQPAAGSNLPTPKAAATVTPGSNGGNLNAIGSTGRTKGTEGSGSTPKLEGPKTNATY